MLIGGRKSHPQGLWRLHLEERIGKLRETIAWLDALPKGTIAAVIDGQRQRAINELTRLLSLRFIGVFLTRKEDREAPSD